MSAPRHVNAWLVLESAEDFAAYPLLLSRDADQARGKGMPWRNDTIPCAPLGERREPADWAPRPPRKSASPPTNRPWLKR